MSGSSSLVVNNEIVGVTKAQAENKEAAGSITGDGEQIDIIKAKLDAIDIGRALLEGWNKEAALAGMVTEDAWITHVYLTRLPAGIQRNAVPAGAMITKNETTGATIMKERVPESFVDILTKRPLFKKLPPVGEETSELYSVCPKLRDVHLWGTTRKNNCIDLHADVVRQHAEKGYAEVGVDFIDGVKMIFILPQD